MSVLPTAPARPLMGLSRTQWIVLLAAWLGWGFDVFDGLLFNYVAPNAVPTLLGLPLDSKAASDATKQWTGALTSVLLLGWAAGGIVFGQIADRIGRTRTLMLTMLVYAIGTAACALAPNLAVLALCRFLAGLGIGGEWAAGASLVAEAVPEERRVEAGALLYTSAPIGLFLATGVNAAIAGNLLRDSPETSWRWVLACGLIPAFFALFVRSFVKEPVRWAEDRGRRSPPRLRELFYLQNVAATRSGLVTAITILITWWSCNAFLSVLATGLAQQHAAGLSKLAARHLAEQWKATANYAFNWGGLVGTLLTIPCAKRLGRKKTFALYLVLASASFFVTFGLDWPPLTRLRLLFLEGLTIFGIFGAFPFYLPELFPTRLRATGAGFCYNIGRVAAAVGPFVVGQIAARGTQSVTQTLLYIGFVPLIGLLFFPWVIETKGRPLPE